jgi:uncharacterized protein YukE
MPLDHSSQNVSGLDVEAVRALASLLAQSADTIRTTTQTISSQMEQTQWNGSDADQYEGEYDGEIMTLLNQIADRLTEHGQKAESNANEQESTSANL